MMKRILFWSAAAAAMLGGVLPQTAQAQGQSGASAARDDEIVVTARRREEALQQTPVSVAAVTAAQIEARGIVSVASLADSVAGLNFRESFGRRDDRPAIRGSTSIGTPDFGVESGAAVFIDGIYVNADISAFGLQNLERVEIVKGPQSALYGRNAYAGAINFVTRRPSNELDVSAFASAAEHDTYEGSLSISGPMSPGVLSGSLFVRHYEYGGEYRNPRNGRLVGDERSDSVSGTLYFTPTDKLEIKTRLTWAQDDDGHIPFGMVVANTDTFPANGTTIGFLQNDDVFIGVLPPTGETLPALEEDLLRVSGLKRESWIATTRADYDFSSGHRFSVLGSYRLEDRQVGSDSQPATPFTPGPTFIALFTGDDQDTREWSLETRIESPTERALRWSLGAFVFDSEIELKSIDPADTTPFGDDRFTENWSAFGSLAYDVTDKLTVTGEVRYAEETKRIENRNPGSAAFDAEATFDFVSPRLTIDYQATDDLLLYVIAARGNKPGGYNDLPNRNPATIFTGGQRTPFFEEETAWVYETGFKSSWFDDRWVLNASVYFNDIENAQLTQTYVTSTFISNSQIVNLQAVETIGAEIETTIRPTDWLQLQASYAHTRPEIQGGVLRDDDQLFDNTANGNRTLAGRIFPRVSEDEFNVAALVTAPLGWATLKLAADYSYESSRFVQVDNLTETGDANLINARAALEFDNVTLAVFGRNIGDEDSIVDGLRFRDQFGRRAYQTVQRKGSTFGVEARVNY